VLGFPNVRLYEGSWTEWSAHPELPVQTEPVALN
jgi:thiosulfate/3-mercaptopyruvate sulfurtransferase